MPTKRAAQEYPQVRPPAPGGASRRGVGDRLKQPRLFHLVADDAPETGLPCSSERDRLLSRLEVIGLSFDPEGAIRSANPRALRLLECTEDELRDRSLQTIVSSSATANGTQVPLRRLLANPERYPTFQTQLILPDKHRLWVKWTGTARYDLYGGLAELLWVGMDITDLKQAERGLLAHQQQLQTVTVHSAVLEARERQSMADAIHENIAQDLAYWRLQLAALQQAQGSPETTTDLGRIVEGVGTLIQRLREVAFQLSPTILYRMGLKSAICCLAEQVGERHGLAVRVESQWVEEEGLPEEVRLVVYQAVRELLGNAVSHAHASEVVVRLESRNGELVVEVIDDGVGFDPQVLQGGG